MNTLCCMSKDGRINLVAKQRCHGHWVLLFCASSLRRWSSPVLIVFQIARMTKHAIRTVRQDEEVGYGNNSMLPQLVNQAEYDHIDCAPPGVAVVVQSSNRDLAAKRKSTVLSGEYCRDVTFACMRREFEGLISWNAIHESMRLKYFALLSV